MRHREEGVSTPAVNMKLAGLAFLFKLQGQPDFTQDFGVRWATSNLCHDARYGSIFGGVC